MTAAQCAALFARLAAAIPEPKTELNYRSHFELLIAVVLSAQATDKSVNLATAGLFAVANTPQAMLALGEEGLRSYIRSIGLYQSKARHIMQLCERLVTQYGGEIPRDRQSLEALPGVGRKTANVILNTAFGEPVIAVDTHIFRVANRTGLAPGKTVREVEQRLEACVPNRYKKDAHHLLILQGRYTCTARKPRCPNCVIAEYCAFEGKTAV